MKAKLLAWFKLNIEPRLVKDWANGKKWISAYALGTLATASGVWATLPRAWQDLLMQSRWAIPVVGVIAAIGFVGRFWLQPFSAGTAAVEAKKDDANV